LKPTEKERLLRKISKMIYDRRAVSNTISATILTGAVIALSLAVFSWSQGRSSEYNREFSETVDAETARLKEKLVFEYIFYGNPSNNITVYLFNCGTMDDVEIKSAYVIKGDWFITFSSPTLHSLDGSPIPDQDLDAGEEGRLVLELSSSLSSGYYRVKVLTGRGAKFDSNFVA
jgi:hypothetical protein